MSNLFATLRTASDMLEVYQKGLQVVQNNIGNANTPGYARRRMPLVAQRFEPDAGIAGGVRAGPLENARNALAERIVQRQMERLGYAGAQAELLGGIEGAFPVSGDRGVPGALNALFRSFSAWSLTPNDANARAAVVEEARGVVQAFADAAAQLAEASRMAEVRLQDTVGQINTLVSRLRDANAEVRDGSRDDAGLDARVHATLEELSGLVNFTVLQQADGTMTVLAGGMAPLLVGNRQYPLSIEFAQPADPAWPDGPAPVRVLDAGGADITARLTAGKLGGALDVRNRALPGLIGDSNQAGDLNRLAMAVAGRVNSLLAAGHTAEGVPGEEELFRFDALNHTAAARTLAVNPAFRPEMLAAVDPGPPYVSNGTALKLAGLAQPQDAADKIDGAGFMQFYAGMAAGVGRHTAEARQGAQLQTEAVAQARAMRAELSGVSLDQEAMLMVEYQRAYQAAAHMISVLNELTGIAVNLLR
jgi:flagellar hook-associated protein 1